MNLSELQTKEIINVPTGTRLGMIIDVIVTEDGYIKEIILEQKRGSKKLINNREQVSIKWQQIIKIGDDIILVDTRKYQ